MADKKISQLTLASTPLSGGETLPVVQTGATVQVSVDNLTAGKNVPAAGLTVNANSAGNAVFINQIGAGNALLVEDSANPDATPFVITGAGNVGIGTTTPSSLLTLSSAAPRMDFVETDVASANTTRLIQEGSIFRIQTVNSGVFVSEDYAIDRNATGATAHRWDIQNVECLRLASTGNLGINEPAPDYRLDVNGTFGFTPGNSVTPVDNGDVVFELTNNTTLTVKAKGSDGVVRSGTITLA